MENTDSSREGIAGRQRRDQLEKTPKERSNSLEQAAKKKRSKAILDAAAAGRQSEKETSRRVYLKTIEDMLEMIMPGESLEPGKDILAETIRGIAESAAKVEGRDAEEVMKEIEAFRTEPEFEKSLRETVRQGYQVRFDKYANAAVQKRGGPKSLDDIDSLIAGLSEVTEREGWDTKTFQKMRDIAKARWTAEILGEKNIWETLDRELEPSDIERMKAVLDIKDPIEMLSQGQELAGLMKEVSKTAEEAWRRLFFPTFMTRPRLLNDSREALSQQTIALENKIAAKQKEWDQRHYELRMQNVPKDKKDDPELVRQVEKNRQASKEHNRAVAALNREISALKEEQASVEAIRDRLMRSINDPDFKKSFIDSIQEFGAYGKTCWDDFVESLTQSKAKRREKYH